MQRFYTFCPNVHRDTVGFPFNYNATLWESFSPLNSVENWEEKQENSIQHTAPEMICQSRHCYGFGRTRFSQSGVYSVKEWKFYCTLLCKNYGSQKWIEVDVVHSLFAKIVKLNAVDWPKWLSWDCNGVLLFLLPWKIILVFYYYGVCFAIV